MQTIVDKQDAANVFWEGGVTFTANNVLTGTLWQDTTVPPVALENNVLTVPYGNPYVAFLCVDKRTEVGVPYTACEARAALGEPAPVAPWIFTGLFLGVFAGWIVGSLGSSKKGPKQ